MSIMITLGLMAFWVMIALALSARFLHYFIDSPHILKTATHQGIMFSFTVFLVGLLALFMTLVDEADTSHAVIKTTEITETN